MTTERALIVGSGSGLSAALARTFAAEGMQIALAARQPAKLAALAAETGAHCYSCDVARRDEIEALFAAVDHDLGPPTVVVFNPGHRVQGSIADVDPAAVEQGLLIGCYGGFLVGQQAARRMLSQGHGTILFTGATASVKGFPYWASFAMNKFGLRGLAQSMARELAPKNIHVAHVVIDGVICPPGRQPDGQDACLDPLAIAATYLSLHRQPRSAWSWEIELRPWVETF